MENTVIAPTFQNLDVLDRYLVPEDIKQMCHSGTCSACEGKTYFTGNICTNDTFSLLVFCTTCGLFSLADYPARKEA